MRTCPQCHADLRETADECWNCALKLVPETARAAESGSTASAGSEIVRRLETYCRGRREVIEASIACERLAGNAPKEMAERTALAEITGFEIWMARGGLSQNAKLCDAGKEPS